MVVIILAVIAGVGVFSLIRFYDLWYLSNFRMELVWSERTVMHDVTKNIRMIKDSESVYVAAPTQFVFDAEDENGVTFRVNYQFIGDELYKDGVVFMDKINSGSFTYYDEDGNTLASPDVNPDRTDIRSVRLILTLESGGETLISQTEARCRNIN